MSRKSKKVQQQKGREIKTLHQSKKVVLLRKKVIEESATQYEGFFGGVSKGWDDFKLKASDTVGNVSEVFGKGFKDMEDALVNFVMTGKLSFNSLIQTMLAGLARVFIQKAMVSAVGMMEFAQGGAFSTGSGIHAYSNSIVTKPTLFPFAKGVGLMGEKAGSPGEAIMPLTRMPSGDLGVQMMGSSGGVNAPVYVTVNVDNTGNATTDVNATAQDSKRLGKIIGAKVREVMLEESRNGGYLSQNK